MKKLILIILFVSVSSSVFASEMGTISGSVSLCEKREAAFPTFMAAMLAIDQGVDIDIICKGNETKGCYFAYNKELRVKVHKMTKEIIKGGKIIHYAQVSLISSGDKIFDKDVQKAVMWIASIFDEKNGIYMIKLDSGKYW